MRKCYKHLEHISEFFSSLSLYVYMGVVDARAYSKANAPQTAKLNLD